MAFLSSRWKNKYFKNIVLAFTIEPWASVRFCTSYWAYHTKVDKIHSKIKLDIIGIHPFVVFREDISQKPGSIWLRSLRRPFSGGCFSCGDFNFSSFKSTLQNSGNFCVIQSQVLIRMWMPWKRYEWNFDLNFYKVFFKLLIFKKCW